MVCSEFAEVFRLSVSMRKVGGEHPFCVLIYMNCYIFHIFFILFILLSYLIFDFVYLTLSSANTHGIAKYARTYMRDTHTQAHTLKKQTEKVERLERLGKKNEPDTFFVPLQKKGLKIDPHVSNLRSREFLFSRGSGPPLRCKVRSTQGLQITRLFCGK